MNKVPFGFQLGARVSGFSAIFAIYLILCVVIFGIASWTMPEGSLKQGIIVVSISVFFALLILGCYIGLAKPHLFSIKEEYRTIIEVVGSKLPGQEPITTMTGVTAPPPQAQLEQKAGKHRESQ